MSAIAPDLRRARIADSCAFGIQGFFFAVVLSHLPQQQEKFGLSDGTIAVGILLASALAGAGSVAAERLALRWSSRAALRLGLLLISVTGCAVAFAPNTPVLLATLGCYGVALGIVDASANMQAVFIQHGYGTVVLASFYAAWSAGAIGGALYVAGTESLDIALRPSLLGAAGIVLVVGLALGPALLDRAAAEAGPAEARYAGTIGSRSTGIAPAATGPGASAPTVRSASAGTGPVASGLDSGEREGPARSGEVRLSVFLALGAAVALVFAIDVSVGSWSALYLTDELRAGSATAALGLAAYQGAALLARLTGDHLVRRFGPRAVVRAVGVLGAVGLALVVAAPSAALALTGFLITGLGVGVIAPLCFSEAGALTSGPALDALVARLNLFNYAGTLVAGVMVGGITAALTYRAGFVVPLVCAAALLALTRAFRPRPEPGGGSGDRAARAVLEP